MIYVNTINELIEITTRLNAVGTSFEANVCPDGTWKIELNG